MAPRWRRGPAVEYELLQAVQQGAGEQNPAAPAKIGVNQPCCQGIDLSLSSRSIASSGLLAISRLSCLEVVGIILFDPELPPQVILEVL